MGIFDINLLPPAYRQKIKLEQINFWIIKSGFLGLFIFSFFVFILLVVYSFLVIQHNSVIHQIEQAKFILERQNKEEIETRVAEFNKIVERLNTLQKQRTEYSWFLIKLAKLVPSEIYFDRILINKNQQVYLVGYAQTRDRLLEFKEKLEDYGEFFEIDFPLSNLVKAKDVDFTIKFYYQPQK